MMDDFKVPEHELAEAITSIFGLEKDAPEKKANKYYYQVRIVIGEPFGAGMAGDGAYIRLIGDKAQSEKAAVKKDWDFFDRHLSRTYSDMTIETDKDLGDILVVSLGIKKDWLPSLKYWYVDYVMVDNQQSKKKKQFPCYHWIGDGDSVSVTANTATLQQVANNPIYLQQRQSQLDKRRKQYVWKWFRDVGLPSGIDATVLSLPLDEEFWAGKLMDFTGTAVKDAVVMGFQKHITNIEEKLFSVDDLSIFEQLAKALGKHEFPVYQAGRWTRDEEFGYQMLNGVNPVVIKQCTAKPANFPVKTEMVRGSLNRGLTLEEEMKAGNVYICDLKVMDGLPCRENYYCPAPLCLLYVNGYSKLVPIAIQLKQVPGHDNPIFLPSDHWIDWLLAKIFYQSAHSQYHELAVHYLSCHAAMEAYAMGIMRNLPDPHPLYKLLRPHIRYTMAINTAARASLINDGGIIDRAFAIGGEGRKELMRRAGKAYSIYWTNIKRSAKKRGVDDTNQLLEYYYRNDGFKIWQAIESYAHDIIYEFYSSDSAVANDQELQYCVTDIHNNGFPGYDGGVQGHGFPKQVDTRDDLVELCTLIMFTGSAQHASVNFGQYDYYGYVPNAPFGVRSPPPTKKGVADYQTLLDTLPDKNTACLSISIAHLLSQYGPKERFLGHYPSERFTEEKAQRMIERFKKSLDGITGDIEERNKSLDVPYVFMLPGRVPNSITI